MSKFVDDIIYDIKNNPNTFNDFKGTGLQKTGLIIGGYGNGKLLSVIFVNINGSDIPTTWRDNYKLEVAIKNWYSTVPYLHLAYP